MKLQRNNARCARQPKFQVRLRGGVATVEFAISASVLFVLFFAALEFCRVASFKQSVELALYEGARTGVVAGATADDVRQEAQRILAISRIQHATVTVTPASINDATEQVAVRIILPLDQGLYGPVRFFGGKSLDRTLVMTREGNRN